MKYTYGTKNNAGFKFRSQPTCKPVQVAFDFFKNKFLGDQYLQDHPLPLSIQKSF